MKRVLTSLLFILCVSVSIQSQAEQPSILPVHPGPHTEQWNSIRGVFSAWSGHQVVISVPPEPVWGRGLFARFRPAYVSEFIIRVNHSTRQSKMCVPAASNTTGGNIWTGVHPSAAYSRRIGTTAMLVEKTGPSPSKPRWTNYHFSVNRGSGAEIVNVTPVFENARVGAVVCNFEVLYRDTSVHTTQPLRSLEGAADIPSGAGNGRSVDESMKAAQAPANGPTVVNPGEAIKLAEPKNDQIQQF